jgi:hypothetical protein
MNADCQLEDNLRFVLLSSVSKKSTHFSPKRFCEEHAIIDLFPWHGDFIGLR